MDMLKKWWVFALSINCLIMVVMLNLCDNIRTKPPGVTATITITDTYYPRKPCAKNKELHAAFIALDYVSYLSLQSKCIDASIRNAFHAGLFDPNASFENSCPDTICTWSDFPTLGICSECADVTKST